MLARRTRTTMCARYRSPCEAQGPRAPRAYAFLWALALLVLGWLALWLPAEAFDGDGRGGLGEALVGSCDSATVFGGMAPAPPASPNLPASPDLTSMRPVASLVAGKPNGPAGHQSILLRASRLCARSRIDEAPALSYGQITSGPQVHVAALLAASLPVGGAFASLAPKPEPLRRGTSSRPTVED